MRRWFRRFMLALLSGVDYIVNVDGVRANGHMKIECKNVPEEALPVIADQLRAFGARVRFSDGWSGVVSSIAGKLLFGYESGTLTVTVIEDAGHFPQAMLIGGIKQTVEEACEIIRRRDRESPGLSMEASA
jgi:hypothetical protein